VLLEDRAYRLQKKFRRQIHHREVLLIERQYRLGLRDFALREILVEIGERFGVTTEIHVHESRELQKTGINPAQCARVPHRHSIYQIAFLRWPLEPGIAAYCERIMALEEMQEWVAAARLEPDEIDELEVEF